MYTIEYYGTNLEAIYHEEGRAVPSVSAYEYQYNLKDHLGNNRVVFKLVGTTATLIQEGHYYPFGMEMEGFTTGSNRYRYNGKELDTDFGLNYYHYGARMYDASVGRFTGVDPLAGKYTAWSPYTYTLNNPIRFIDPDGREVIAPNEASRQLVLQSVTYMFGENHGFSFDGSKLTHSGTMPEGLSEGQSLMFSYFNDALVNSDTKTTVRANQRHVLMETGAEAPVLKSVSGTAAATTFGVGSFKKMAGTKDFQVGVTFDAQNQILVPSETVTGGTNVMTKGGSRQIGADHVLSHEFGHAIVNTIMNEFGGQFNGVVSII